MKLKIEIDEMTDSDLILLQAGLKEGIFKMEPWQIQIATLSKVALAYGLYNKTRNAMLEKKSTGLIGLTPLNYKEVLEFDTQLESYRMLIINYLMVLVGKGRNDQISIFKRGTEQQKQELQKFCSVHTNELESLKTARDKVYSHIDEELGNGKLEHKFIKEFILFLKQLLSADGIELQKETTNDIK